MKIAMIGQKGVPAQYGGVDRHVEDLSVRLVEAGHTVIAYSRFWYTKTTESEYLGVQTVYTPSIHTKHLDTITHTLTSTLHALWHGVDIIHYHGVGPALLSWMPRVFSPKTTVITTFHSIDRYAKKWNLLARLALRFGEWAAVSFAHKTITISKGLQQYVLNEFGKETAYIPNAVMSARVPHHTDVLDMFGLEKGKYIVMVSRLVPNKGIHLLIEAFHLLKQYHKDDLEIQEMKLAIVGGAAYSDEYVRRLHETASRYSEIVFTDFQSGDALDQLYAHARALVHPSLHEGLPITVLQAMNFAKPVLVSNIPEHLELIQDNRMIFEQNDVHAITQALYHLLQIGSEELKEIGRKNKALVDREYSWDVVLPKMIALYRETEKEHLFASAV